MSYSIPVPAPDSTALAPGMRVRVDYSSADARRIYQQQHHSGATGTIDRRADAGLALLGREAQPGGIWAVNLDDVRSQEEGFQVHLAGCALVPLAAEPAPEPEPELTYERVMQIGICAETKGDLSRWSISAEECVWLNEAEERLCEPGEEDGEQPDPEFYERGEG